MGYKDACSSAEEFYSYLQARTDDSSDGELAKGGTKCVAELLFKRECTYDTSLLDEWYSLVQNC